MSNPIVTITNLEKTFLGAGEPLTILKDLDMTIESGSKTIIFSNVLFPVFGLPIIVTNPLFILNPPL